MHDTTGPARGGDLVYEPITVNGVTIDLWTTPGFPGLRFGTNDTPKRERDPRNIPGGIVNDTPHGLEPCHLHSVMPADAFLPVAEEHFWRPGESLWYGTMKAERLEVHTEIYTNVYKELIGFFKNPRTLTWDSKNNCYENHMPEKWRPIWGTPEITTAPDYPPDMCTETLCKALWLITEYLDNNKRYDNPMCAHYNPTRRDNIIHPGGFRKKLLKMYNSHGDDVRMFYFNTLGFYHEETMKDLERYDFPRLKSEVFDGYMANGALVAEHGTMIPHIYVGSTVIYNRQHEFLDLIQERVSQSNFNISFSENWVYQEYRHDLPLIMPITDYGKAYCNVEIKSDNHPWAKVSQKYYRDMLVIQSLIHLLLNRPYEDEKIKIEFQS
jgi:hypothetical protein